MYRKNIYYNQPMIQNTNKFGELGEIELRDFQKENGIALPEEYKTFLQKSNGIAPNPNQNKTPSAVVTYILGMHNGPYYASLYKHIDMFKNRLPLSTLPIATDAFGNLFILSVHQDRYGYIYFWDHEGEPEYQDGHYVDNCYFVSYSFDAFIHNLF